MILKKKYLEEERKQQVWYDSSMISYSEMREDEFENKGELIIIFKNGTAYSYKDVSFEDYLVFIGGGTDASQGKTLNKVIKGKYEYEKITNINVEELLNQLYEKEDIIDNSNTYFISGHRNLTENEFEFYYIPTISNIVANNPNAKFVIGDSCGCDIMAQNYLINVLGVNPGNITVYCVGDAPEYVSPEIIYFKTNFKDHDEKDSAMTKASFEDIAFVRDWKVMSGTAQNILRRYSFDR